MKFQILSRVVEELSSLIIGARVERVYQGEEGGLYCLLRCDRKEYILLLSPDRTLPRLHLVSAKPRATLIPHPFVLYLRSHLTGASILTIALLNEDRVVEIRFSKSGIKYCLVFELIGSSANLILIDSSSKILSLFYPSPLFEHGGRLLMPGLPYVPPEKKPIKSAGMVVRDTVSQSETITIVSSNKEAEIFYEQLHQQKALESIRTGFFSILHKAVLRTERRIVALSQDLNSAGRAEEYKQAGDLVLANLGRLRTGMELVELTGYDGNTVSVRLDPKFSPSRNADRCFKKYKKAKAGHTIIAQRLRQTEEEALSLKTLRARLCDAESQNDFAGIRSALIAGGYIKTQGKGRAHTKLISPGYRTITVQGWEILVGKGASGNDFITTKIARADDLWLHAEGLPGSHVLVKNPNNTAIPEEVLRKAASLAAYYSKGKNAGKVSVTYTRAGFVKKPKGAKPGLVTLTKRKSIMVKPENYV